MKSYYFHIFQLAIIHFTFDLFSLELGFAHCNYNNYESSCSYDVHVCLLENERYSSVKFGLKGQVSFS